ncbi:MAG: sigma-54-dependent Fis family transcriptional regulator [Verrucomicrobia bacterium]|nr:sigma-54-dependent Fis family transcriptional regulator [Verrucomicrobiota bacterium]
MKPKLLLIEDDGAIAVSLRKEFQAEGYDVAHESRGDTGLAHATQHPCDVVLTDLKMPGLSGLDIVARLHQARPKLPIILMTAHGTTESAIEAIKLGAFDYVLKPFDMAELLELTAKAVACNRLMSESVELGDAGPSRSAIVGRSRAMQELYKEIGRVAATSVTVLIRGDTGTGKELVARALYQHSTRAAAPFIPVNCAAVPETLLESELFGHERGAFTGAEARRIGRFEQATAGTLFLDEVGDMSLGTQAKLLRILQEKAVQRVGGKELVPVDVRILAATNRDLEQAIAERQFREDLFFRLSVVTITLPPLSERAEDVPDLVKYFLRRYGEELGAPAPAILPEALELLSRQQWPGNVRQLENVVRQVLLLARGFDVSPDHVQQVLARLRRPVPATNQTIAAYIADLLNSAQRCETSDVRTKVIEDMERELFAQAIQLAGGNQAKAARWLGVTRLTMREKLQHFGLRPATE